MKSLTKKLRQKDGLSYPFIVCLVLVLLIMVLGVCEVIRLNIISANVRNKFQEVIISETTDNYIKMYQPLRDGYAASYQYNGSGWQQNSVTTNNRIRNSLNNYFSGGESSQVTVQSVSYSINTSTVAPSNAYTALQYNVRGQVVVIVPYKFLWADLPPIRLTVNVNSTWRQMF